MIAYPGSSLGSSMDEEPTQFEIAKSVANYLVRELERNTDEFIYIHRNIAAVMAGLANAVAESLEKQANLIN